MHSYLSVGLILIIAAIILIISKYFSDRSEEKYYSERKEVLDELRKRPAHYSLNMSIIISSTTMLILGIFALLKYFFNF